MIVSGMILFSTARGLGSRTNSSWKIPETTAARDRQVSRTIGRSCIILGSVVMLFFMAV